MLSKSSYDDGPTEANRTRARWALAGLEAFGEQTGQRYGFETLDVGKGILGEVAGDFLADLFHLARFNDMEPDELIRRAVGLFQEEVAEEEEEQEELSQDDSVTPALGREGER